MISDFLSNKKLEPIILNDLFVEEKPGASLVCITQHSHTSLLQKMLDLTQHTILS